MFLPIYWKLYIIIIYNIYYIIYSCNFTFSFTFKRDGLNHSDSSVDCTSNDSDDMLDSDDEIFNHLSDATIMSSDEENQILDQGVK